MSIERWVPIKGWEGLYEVSSLGRVKTVAHIVFLGHRKSQKSYVKEKIREYTSLIDGYRIINLCKRPRIESWLVHRLVAFNFLENPENKSQVNHINGDKSDNRVENLEWATARENMVSAVNSGLINPSKPKRKPLDRDLVLEIFKSSLSLGELSKKYNVPKLVIQSIKSGKRRGNITGKKYFGKK